MTAELSCPGLLFFVWISSQSISAPKPQPKYRFCHSFKSHILFAVLRRKPNTRYLVAVLRRGEEDVINTALDATVAGTWYVLAGSTLAFVASAVINNFANFGIGKLFKSNPDGATAFFLRSYVSTAIGQFADNMILRLP